LVKQLLAELAVAAVVLYGTEHLVDLLVKLQELEVEWLSMKVNQQVQVVTVVALEVLTPVAVAVAQITETLPTVMAVQV
jgi:hypothetical protein